jgi:plasmid replication initiation protein
MTNLISIQERYMETVSAGMDRWLHRRDGGHSGRIRAGAYRKARKALLRMGFTLSQVEAIIRDAHDVMLLERAAVDDPLNFAEN